MWRGVASEADRPGRPKIGRAEEPEPVLRFAERHGLPRPALDEAERLGKRWGVPADVAALRSGLVEVEALYRALAAECGLPFRADGLAIHPWARYPEAVLSGVAPIAGPGPGTCFALAPEGRAFADLLARRGRLPAGLVVTTPAALRSAVTAARADAIAREAADSLPARRPTESYRDGPSLAQLAALYAAGFGTALALATAPAGALQAASAVLCLPFLGLIAIKLGATLEAAPIAPPRPPPREDEADLPVYSVLVPLYRERRVLPKLCAALSALDYPSAKLDVQLIVEEDDAETRDALREVALPPFASVLVAPRGAPRTKPRALNVALPLARGDFVVVYDAEDVPDPGQLRLAVATFERAEPTVACLQARLVIDNTADGWLPGFFTVDYGTLFDVVNPALARFDLPVPLGGTSNHFRTEILRRLGGWDPWNVTEDADLAMRLATAGLRVADLPSATLEEAPRTLPAWLAQRTRWMKGFVQTAITHSREPIRNFDRLGAVRLLGATAVTLGVVMSALVYPIFTALAIVSLLDGSYLHPRDWAELVVAALGVTTAAAGLLAMTLPGFVAIRRRGWWALWPYAVLMPLYYLLVSVAAWRALGELALDPDRWNKTEHGLAQSSRAAEPAPLKPA